MNKQNTYDGFLETALSQIEGTNYKVEQTEVTVITGDASFRKYYRVVSNNHSYILMSSPPALVDNQAFIELNTVFESSGVKVPKILSFDNKCGYVLLEDLGQCHFADVFDNTQSIEIYYQAINLLPQIATTPVHTAMKPYDASFIDLELEIFNEWLIDMFCQLEMDEGAKRTWINVKQQLINAMLMQPTVTMHRDYHSRNLMLANSDWTVIDYQDAVQGPLTYDLVSLLKDCYLVLEPHQRETLLNYGFETLQQAKLTQELTYEDFKLLFTLTGIQRHLKAAGIFCRLALRDNKFGYLPHIEDTLTYVIEACNEIKSQFSIFEYFAQWLQKTVRPNLQNKLKEVAK